MASAQRQPQSPVLGITKVPISAAMIQPTAQNDSSRTVMRPRCLVGENSETSVEATGSSAPRPRPMIRRAPSSMPSDQDRAMAPFASPKMTSVAVNTVLRPTRSAMYPPSAAPMAMPTNPMDSTHDFSVGSRLKCGSAAMAATTKDTSPTSIASKAQPMPEAMRSLRCALLNGSRSRRSLRVSCCVSVMLLLPLLRRAEKVSISRVMVTSTITCANLCGAPSGAPRKVPRTSDHAEVISGESTSSR